MLYSRHGIEVISTINLSNDFNFFIGIDYNRPCIRISSRRLSIKEEQDLNRNGYTRNSSYDINYIAEYKENLSSYKYQFLHIDSGSFYENQFDIIKHRDFRNYLILLDGKKIGKISLLITDIIGIYDFEIFEKFRYCGHGKSILLELRHRSNKNLFVQTWAENLGARSCYENAGFWEYEKLYRYE